MVFKITKSCNLPCICCYPSCVEVIAEVVVGCVGIPLSVEVIVIVVKFGFVPIPLVRGDCWLFG